MQALHPGPTTFTCPYCEHKNDLYDVREGEVITCGNPMCQRHFQAELPKVPPDPELIIPHEDMVDQAEPEKAPTTPQAQPATTPEATPHAIPVGTAAPATGTSISAPETPTVVATYRPPMLTRHPVRFLINVGLMLLGLAGLVWSFLQAWPVLLAFSLVPLVYGAARQFVWGMRARHTTLNITTRGVVFTTGLFSVSSREVYHESIRGIHIFQPWWGWLTGTGALMIDYGDQNEQLYLDAVPHPHKIAELLRQQAKK
jgi:hypothetical protein